jgi:hypothetical protein
VQQPADLGKRHDEAARLDGRFKPGHDEVEVRAINRF